MGRMSPQEIEMPLGPVITHQWRGDFVSAEVEALHADGFGRAPGDYLWKAQVERPSLGWVCTRCGAELVSRHVPAGISFGWGTGSGRVARQDFGRRH